jgi:hypothetical protein
LAQTFKVCANRPMARSPQSSERCWPVHAAEAIFPVDLFDNTLHRFRSQQILDLKSDHHVLGRICYRIAAKT